MLFFIFRIVFILLIVWGVFLVAQNVLRKRAKNAKTEEQTTETKKQDDWDEF